MSPREQLNSYIRQIERRLKTDALLRGIAVLIGTALIVTFVLVLILNHYAFPKTGLVASRSVLFLILAAVIARGIIWPLRLLTRYRAVVKAESAFPQFQQRLVTFAERDQSAEPFIDLLAADTLNVAQTAEPTNLVSNGKYAAWTGAGAVALVVLVWMIMSGPGYLGYGASLLWAGERNNDSPLYDLHVSPGNATVRRNTDQMVMAQLKGLQTEKVRLFARYESASKWEPVAMQAQAGGSKYQFLFAGLPEAVEYYVEAGALKSPHFTIQVADLPAVKKLKVTYRYPAWTGMAPSVEDNAGDLRALEGTVADLEVTMDRPLSNGVLVLDEEKQIELSGGEGNIYKGSIRMERDGAYHIGALDRGQSMRLSEDYFIAAAKANPPEIQIVKPGRDYRASPIEEVGVAVQANDDFGLKSFDLHFSVNGGPEKTIDLLKTKNEKKVDGSTTLFLEDYKLVPGDIISMYATAKDARAETKTDIMFVEADPFEREFSQSQAGGAGGGGGGGGGQDQQEISRREKEIIANTWQQVSKKAPDKQKGTDTAKFLSDVQAKLQAQAVSLSGRLQSRELTSQNEEFSAFQKDMSSAAEAMGPATDKLKLQKWAEALPDEQKALQYLLRAEATFRKIQVAFGNSGGGGGGGGSAGRDLASLFDLELDTQKNQYETNQTANDKKGQDIDEALRKLDELAKRQESLSEQQRTSNQNFDQRWQQEMLRRDAEELQKQLEQMARQQGQSGSSGQSSSGQSGSGQSSQSASNSNIQQALDRVRQAREDMQRASSQGQNQADARRAAERLKEAMNLMGGPQSKDNPGRMDSLNREADRIAAAQREQADRMRKLAEQSSNGVNGDSGSGGRDQQRQRLANDRQRLSDDYARLEKGLRDSARDMAGSDRTASSKIREALGQANQADLSSRFQRSADRLRQGSELRGDASEAQIASALQNLRDQLQQARQLSGNGQGQNAQEALNRVDRLRDRMEALGRGRDRNGEKGREGQRPGDYQPGQLSRGQQNGGGNQQGGQQNGGQSGGNQRGSQPGQPGGQQAGGGYGGYDGAYRGGYDNGYAYGGGWDGSRYQEQYGAIVTPQQWQRAYTESMRELNDLNRSLQDNPDAKRQVQELIRQMQGVDPGRFPGNPALVEALHDQVLSTLDKLELQLRRNQEEQLTGQVRASDLNRVPSGYQDAVAEYYRRLSKKQ